MRWRWRGLCSTARSQGSRRDAQPLDFAPDALGIVLMTALVFRSGRRGPHMYVVVAADGYILPKSQPRSCGRMNTCYGSTPTVAPEPPPSTTHANQRAPTIDHTHMQLVCTSACKCRVCLGKDMLKARLWVACQLVCLRVLRLASEGREGVGE